MSASKTVIKRSSKIIGRLNNVEDIVKFVRTPSWSIRELFSESTPSVKVDHKKFNRLSGLNLSSTEINEILSSQLQFIKNLQDIQIGEDDHISKRKSWGKKLTYKDLIAKIESQKPDPQKGETSGSWDPLSMPSQKSGNYYVLNESLKNE